MVCKETARLLKVNTRSTTLDLAIVIESWFPNPLHKPTREQHKKFSGSSPRKSIEMASLRYYSVIYTLIDAKVATARSFYAKSTLAPFQIESRSVITSSQRPNTLCRYKRVSLLARCMLKVKEKYFKTKYRPAGILRNVNSAMYFKFKLQFKFRN